MPHRRTTPPALSIRTNSPDLSHPGAPFYDSSDDSEGIDVKVTMAEYVPSKPLTVSIPRNISSQGPYCPRRPNLSEILANTAQPPWTLSAFMAYLSQNHCLETLEFTMDASRYRKHYSKMVNREPGSSPAPSNEECAYVKMLWQRLLEAYIAPNGPREVNLPSNVRDSLLSLDNGYMPPHPSALDTAVAKIYELMEESVLVPFLNSIGPQGSAMDGLEDFPTSNRRLNEERQAQPYLAVRQHQSIGHGSPSGSHQRASAPAAYSRSLGPPSNANAHAHNRFASGPPRYPSSQSPSYISNASGSENLTDDSGSVSSPVSDPMTPPTTPPMSDYSGGWAAGLYSSSSGHGNGNGPSSTHSSANNSPRSTRAEHSGFTTATANQWKRVSHKLGWKKRSGSALREEEEGAGPMEE